MRYAVTGAFGYSGRYIAQRLLDAGHDVITLTNSAAKPDLFAGKAVKASPLCFDDPYALEETLKGVQGLVNTYWVRFNHAAFSFADAVTNSEILFQAAAKAGVERIVHLSITNPSGNSPYEYFRGKAAVEEALESCGVSHAILRPAILFGGDDVLLNNIAWTLRKFPVFGLLASGDYNIEPIHVEDLAKLAADNLELRENAVIDAIGPETFSFLGLVRAVREAIGSRAIIVPAPPVLGYLASKVMGMFLNDVMLTWSEMGALLDGLLATDSPPAGGTKLTEYLEQNADTIGRQYQSELARRKKK